MAELDPVVHSPASHTSNNDLDDDQPMDEDEHLDYADQVPLPLPTPTGVTVLQYLVVARFQVVTCDSDIVHMM